MRIVEVAPIMGICVALTLGLPGFARAGELVSDTNASGPANPGYIGQAITTPIGASPFDDITFSWLDSGTPVAGGNLFIFTTLYTGTAAGLSSAGYYAESTGVSGGVWSFASSVLLSADTTYYFYSDSPSLAITFDVSGGANGGYFADGAEPDFTLQSGLEQNFILSGQAAVLPEPSSLALLAGAVTAVAAAKRRKAPTR
jgi:hypothetical protein